MKKLLLLTVAPLLSMTLSAQEAAPSGSNLTALQQADRQFLAMIDASASAAPVLETPATPAPAPTVPAFRQTAPGPVESARPKTVREQPAKKTTSKTTRTTRVEKPREIAPPVIPRAIPVVRVAPTVEPRTVFRILGKPRVTLSATPWITVKTTTVTTRSHRDDNDDDDDEDDD